MNCRKTVDTLSKSFVLISLRLALLFEGEDPKALFTRTFVFSFLLVASMGQGHFTTGGHFIALRDVTSEGKLPVADPVSCGKSQ